MADALQNYLRKARDEGKKPNLPDFERFRGTPADERSTDPLAHHSHYLDAHGNAFTIDTRTTEEDVRRRRRAEAALTRPAPRTAMLQADTPEHRMASAAHAAEIVRKIREEQE